MKNKLILLMVSLFAVFTVSAQEPYSVDSVLQVPGKNADQIFEAVQKWLMTNVDVKSETISMVQNNDRKTFFGKAIISFDVKNMTWYAMSGIITATFDIAVRDGRFKVKFTDFVHDSTTKDQVTGTWDEGLLYTEIPIERTKGIGAKQHKEVYKRAKQRINEWCDQQFASLYNYVNNFSKQEDDDNW